MPGRRPKPSPSSTPESVGERLARLRRERGITQIELAKKLGVGQSVVSHYERSRRGLDSDLVRRLTTILGVSADELLGLQPVRSGDLVIQRRFLRKLRDVGRLSRRDQNALLRTIEAFIRGQLPRSA